MNDRSDSLPFEVHVTVRSPDLTAFREFCSVVGVKPIILDLQDREGTSVLTDVMTSSKVNGSDRDAMNHAASIAMCLKIAGFDVVRQKVESAPWHPDAPKRGDGRAMPKGSYFESHLAVTTTDDRLGALGEHARRLDCHLSRNVLKRLGETVIVMLTHRHYNTTAEDFREHVDRVADLLVRDGFVLGKVEVEFCVHDSKIMHDAAWLAA